MNSLLSRLTRCGPCLSRTSGILTRCTQISSVSTSSFHFGSRCPASRSLTELAGFRCRDQPDFLRTGRGFASTRDILANHDIPFPRVRVVDDSGLVGDFNLQEALILAKQRRTDLVVLSGQVDPPLCRLVNLHVYIDELEKQATSKEQKRREQKLREFSFDPAMRVKGWIRQKNI